MNFDWKAEGFESLPTLGSATGDERLYRAWGDPKFKLGNPDRDGVCYSLDRASSRWEAEMLYAVMEYQNSVWYLTEFSIPKDLPIWVGKVHPGDPRAVLGSVSGRQVLIERAYVKSVKVGATTPLQNDLDRSVVFGGRVPGSFKVASKGDS